MLPNLDTFSLWVSRPGGWCSPFGCCSQKESFLRRAASRWIWVFADRYGCLPCRGCAASERGWCRLALCWRSWSFWWVSSRTSASWFIHYIPLSLWPISGKYNFFVWSNISISNDQTSNLISSRYLFGMGIGWTDGPVIDCSRLKLSTYKISLQCFIVNYAMRAPPIKCWSVKFISMDSIQIRADGVKVEVTGARYN